MGLLFGAAGVLKLGHASDLAATITAFGLGLPPPLVAVIAIALPPFEILLGLYLIAGWLLGVSATIASLLFAAFIAVLASVVARHITAPCGCFGPQDTAPATWWTVGRDALFLIPALYLVWWSRARTSE